LIASQNGVDQDNKKDEAVPQGIASPFYPLIKKGVKMNKKETDGFSIKVTSSTKRADDPPIYTDDKVVPKFRIIDNQDKTRDDLFPDRADRDYSDPIQVQVKFFTIDCQLNHMLNHILDIQKRNRKLDYYLKKLGEINAK
jgi:hypothetical protein